MGAGDISVLVTLRNQIVLILMQEWTMYEFEFDVQYF